MAQKVAITPKAPAEILDAVKRSGAEVVDPGSAEVLVWFGGKPAELREVLDRSSGIRWVQLPFAGIENMVEVLDHDRVWTCAKGVYGHVVAEHGLALMLTAARRLHRYSAARSWKAEGGRTLRDTHAVILGGGGITESLVGMLGPLDVRTTVVRKHLKPIPGADLTIGPGDLPEALGSADWVVVAWALTPETEGAVNADVMRRMPSHAWIVNLARGRHIVTDDLVEALREGTIGGAALDVTDPEPLPDGHPLWEMDNAIITPHVANHWEIGLPLLAERVAENLRRDREGEELLGLVDVDLGY